MDSIRAYLLSVVAAAIISAIALKLVGTKSAYFGIIRLLTGLFLSITVISPLAKLSFSNIGTVFDSVQTDASVVVTDGKILAEKEMAEIIKENTEAYILDKATTMGVDLAVKVQLADGMPPTPESVVISGSVAPYTKKQLQKIIEQDLAIAKENQTWT